MTTLPAAQAWPWPDSLDALVAAPQYHFLLLENETVRVLNVIIGPGELVPVHTHCWPSVVYTVKAGDFVRRDGQGTVLFDSRTIAPDAQLPAVAWIPPLPPHSVENVGQAEIRLFTVELKNRPASAVR